MLRLEMAVIIADGQGSGKSAKLTSNLVVTKAMNLLAEGARDGAVARASHDFLYTVKSGKVSATLTINALRSKLTQLEFTGS
ncbi:MAG: hypothetical protein KGZ96_00320 [Clostridia bacterium]|nr:hypothetical protein [Clostridia bacterium]